MKLFAWLFLIVHSPLWAQAATLTYRLDAGSQITIFETGVTESLSGTFTWEVGPNIGSYVAMSPIALSFHSASVSLLLDPANDRGTSVFFENDPDRCLGDICETFFGAAVQIYGLDSVADGTSLGFSNFGNGAYDGDTFSPSHLSYDNLRLIPDSGGGSPVRIEFSATLVPLPGAFLFLAFGIIVLAARGTRT